MAVARGPGWLTALRRVLGIDPALRVRGEPTSANGASSCHLWWDLPAAGPVGEVSAVLEIIEPPQVGRLYFWALQVTFAGGPMGEGAHLGLQHHPRFPGTTAANWGGYASRADGGGLLQGSPSPLPSTPDDPNTRDFGWKAQTPYRLRVHRSPDPAPEGYVAWRGEIEDLAVGDRWTVRDLYARGDRLATPVVWTESFARCDHPPAAVRWSDMRARTLGGDVVSAAAVRVNYQRESDGGCSNTNVERSGGGVVQRTGVTRETPQGAVLSLG